MLKEKQYSSCPSCAKLETIVFDCDGFHVIDPDESKDGRHYGFYTGTCSNCGCAVREIYEIIYYDTQLVVPRIKPTP